MIWDVGQLLARYLPQELVSEPLIVAFLSSLCTGVYATLPFLQLLNFPLFFRRHKKGNKQIQLSVEFICLAD